MDYLRELDKETLKEMTIMAKKEVEEKKEAKEKEIEYKKNVKAFAKTHKEFNLIKDFLDELYHPIQKMHSDLQNITSCGVCIRNKSPWDDTDATGTYRKVREDFIQLSLNKIREDSREMTKKYQSKYVSLTKE